MDFFVLTKDEINRIVASEIIDLINKKERPVLGLATGSTPLGVYANLVDAYKNNVVSFKNVETYNLDEYVGLHDNHNQSYRYFMNNNLFNLVDVDINKTHFPSDNINSKYHYSNYDNEIINSGGIDIQILGIGSNGHIAFNEPGTSFSSLTHVVELKESTIIDNSRFFKSIEDVPKKAVSMGLKSIMNARRIILIAFGKNKAKAIRDLVNNKPNISLPASILMEHKNTVIYCDNEASSLIE